MEPVEMPDGRVLVSGGTHGVGASQVNLATTEIFDPNFCCKSDNPNYDVISGYYFVKIEGAAMATRQMNRQNTSASKQNIPSIYCLTEIPHNQHTHSTPYFLFQTFENVQRPIPFSSIWKWQRFFINKANSSKFFIALFALKCGLLWQDLLSS